ncbi:MAG TPA: cysteine-rich CWC family protein [Burkholderiales bacterium]|nr:cysteine-rich CWC family protein [Burkholderiales bacterium]
MEPGPEKRCAACGVPFVCGASAPEEPCWCASLPPLKPVSGRDCLCRSCLEEELKRAQST